MKTNSSGAIPAYAQRKIARTNGRMWRTLAGRLTELPIPRIPLPEGEGGRLLDIGCGWGRWTASAARRGYVPVGLDIQFDAAKATLETLRSRQLPGHVVVGDLRALPFRESSFDVAWSFSVLQHAHRDNVAACLDDVRRVLRSGGTAKLEFPTKWGLRNMLSRMLRRVDEDERDSWCVRYYTLRELRRLMASRFERTGYVAHAYFGTGILLDDLAHVPRRFAPVILSSASLARISRVVPLIARMADSVYVFGTKS